LPESNLSRPIALPRASVWRPATSARSFWVNAQPFKLANIAICDSSRSAESQGFAAVAGRCWATEDRCSPALILGQRALSWGAITSRRPRCDSSDSRRRARAATGNNRRHMGHRDIPHRQRDIHKRTDIRSRRKEIQRGPPRVRRVPSPNPQHASPSLHASPNRRASLNRRATPNRHATRQTIHPANWRRRLWMRTLCSARLQRRGQ
jgi:hypothetical protein